MLLLSEYLSLILFSVAMLTAFLSVLKSKRFNTKGNLFLAFFLFSYSFYWIEFVLKFFKIDIFNKLIFINSILSILSVGAYYISVLYFTSLKVKYEKQKMWFGFPIVLLLLIVVLQLIFPVYEIYGLYATIVFSGVYGYKSFILLNKHQKQIKYFSSNIATVDLQWLKNITLALLILFLFQIGLLFFNDENYLELTMPIMNLLFVLYLFYNIETQIEIYPINLKQKENLQEFIEKPKKKLLTDDEFETQKQKLIQKLTKEQLFLNNELNLVKLADVMQMPVHQLSYLINSGFNENFSSFINGYRVEYAKKLLADKLSKLSILGIALESGFNSKTAFYNAFKKQTQLSPTEYKKLHSN